MNSNARREHILETAAQIIINRGLSECTLEEVGLTAGVSKALVYKHFPNREHLLAALMMREFEAIKNRGLSTAERSPTIEHYYRTRTQPYFDYVKERGAILKALFSDRAVYDLLVSENRSQRRTIEDYNVHKVRQAYRLPEDLARLGVVMTLYSPDNADHMLKAGAVTTERAADFWITFLLGGWLATSVRFGGQEHAPEANATASAKPLSKAKAARTAKS
jgi:AcrR family transcriptional regulator